MAELLVARAPRMRCKRCVAGQLAVSAFVFVATALAGCGLSDGVGSLMVDPARYAGYHCNELVGQWKGAVAREKELRGLIDKANDGGGSSVIGALAYSSEYQTVLEQEKVIQRTAADAKCELGPSYKSDQTIR